MTSPQSLRMTARDMERDARELEEVISTIAFLNEHPECKPTISVEFGGFKSDGSKAAEQLKSWLTDGWEKRRLELLEHFRARKKALEDRWK